MLNLGGFVPFSASDYPGYLACVAFIQGCNWQCSYCHNPHLQSRHPHPLAPSWPQVLEFLSERQNLLDAVVFSGGEPTMDPALPTAIKQAKSLGFKIGLHTTGAYTKRFAQILPDLDWVGFDFKAPWHTYHKIIERKQPLTHVQDSMQQLLTADCAYEIRTTIHSSLHQPADLLAMAEYLSTLNIGHWVLQHFRAEGCINNTLSHLQPHQRGLLGKTLISDIRELVPQVTIR